MPSTSSATDGKASSTQTSDYDVIVLDLMLPLLDGLSVLKTLREKKVATTC